MDINNLFANLCASDRFGEEQFDTLLQSDTFRLERIVSTGHATPVGTFYDQEWDEWVILLTGSAEIQFIDPDERIRLSPGDHLRLPAHRLHRVDATDRNEATVWLALHYQPIR
ncbi:MAG: cupin domain-containing protein [Gammaproteobacteria bacterium]|nr:cupin domain-containing protein [Gammaproteobacteria bacterium]MCP5135597.1 cupin domain-containing protein [Gammaproteobacteria bacterium]